MSMPQAAPRRTGGISVFILLDGSPCKYFKLVLSVLDSRLFNTIYYQYVPSYTSDTNPSKVRTEKCPLIHHSGQHNGIIITITAVDTHVNVLYETMFMTVTNLVAHTLGVRIAGSLVCDSVKGDAATGDQGEPEIGDPATGDPVQVTQEKATQRQATQRKVTVKECYKAGRQEKLVKSDVSSAMGVQSVINSILTSRQSSLAVCVMVIEMQITFHHVPYC